MKKLLILIVTVVPLFGLVWSEDPSLTEEQKEERREINKHIAENMRKMSQEKQRWTKEQIKDSNDQEKEGSDPKTWGPSAAGESTENQVPDFHVGGPGTTSPIWWRPSNSENKENDTQEDSD